jgi:hypothetical protein
MNVMGSSRQTAVTPGQKAERATISLYGRDNTLRAVDVWYNIDKHWLIESQPAMRARRALSAAAQ